MAVSGISRLAKLEKKSQSDLRALAEALYLKLHITGLQAKQKVAVITQMLGMVSDAFENEKIQQGNGRID